MKEIAEIILPKENRYTDEHIWIKQDGDSYFVGVSDFAQDQLGEVVYVDLPSIGNTFEANESFGEVESIKSVNKLFMPVSGKIIAINNTLEDTPSLINVSCYEQAWIVCIQPHNIEDIEKLLSAEAYIDFLKK